jgi:hypothetical protein
VADNFVIANKQQERATFLRLALNILEGTERRRRPLSRGEEGMISEFMKRAQEIEYEIASLRTLSEVRETDDRFDFAESRGPTHCKSGYLIPRCNARFTRRQEFYGPFGFEHG